MDLSGKGYILMSIVLTTFLTIGLSTSETIRDIHDLCRKNRHIEDRYMEQNGNFRLNIVSNVKSNGSDKMALRKFRSRCSLTLKVCSSCHISILIQNMSIPKCSNDCSCNFFRVHEPLSDYVSEMYCGDQGRQVMYFESKTRVIRVDFVQSVHKRFYVSLTFNVSSNVYFITESSDNRPRYIESPHFPAKYPLDYTAKYYFQTLRPRGFVQLNFLDFQLSRWSYIEVSGHNGTRTDTYYGEVSRPPVIRSQRPTLNLRFVAASTTSDLGFRLVYSYHESARHNPNPKPRTDCGEIKSEGSIKFKAPPNIDVELFDCIWIVSPSFFAETNRFIAASISKYKTIGMSSIIEFREGTTSKSELRADYRCKEGQNCVQEGKEVIVAADSGLYIRFQGNITADFFLEITYHTFRVTNCSSEEFACRYGKCLNILLRCDGIKQCSDGMDEINCTALVTTEDRLWHDEPVNFEVPEKKDLTLFNSSLIISLLVVGSCVLLLALLTSMKIIVGRCRNRVRASPEDLEESIPIASPPLPPRFLPSAFRLARMDGLPSYEHVITFNDRYPPLFYTRRNRMGNTLETCLSTAADSDKVSLNSSDFLTCSDEFPRNVNDSLVINLSNTSEFRSLGITVITKRLRKSVSMDAIINRKRQCSCRIASIAVGDCACPTRRLNSWSEPLRHDLQGSSGYLNHDTLSLNGSFNCSIVANIPASVSDLIVSLNRDFNPETRSKAYSF